MTAGVYTVSASHPSWKLDGAPREVTINWGNAGVSKDFTVTGYDLSGSVVADGNPILGVQVSSVSLSASPLFDQREFLRSPFATRQHIT